jgi:hypothetical protein
MTPRPFNNAEAPPAPTIKKMNGKKNVCTPTFHDTETAAEDRICSGRSEVYLAREVCGQIQFAAGHPRHPHRQWGSDHERQIPPGGQWNFRRRRPRGRSKAPHTRCGPRNRAQLTACLKDFSRSHCGRIGDFSIGVLTSFVFSLSHNGLPFPPTLCTLLQLVEAHFPTSFVLRRIR